MNVETTRRDMLKGVGLGAGAAVLTPILGQLAAHAAGDAKAANRLRVVFVMQGNGMMVDHLFPSGVKPNNKNGRSDTTKLIDVDLKDRDLHAALEPLTPFKNRLGLIQGLSNRIAYSDHSCEFGALGCCPKNKPHNATIDHVLADAIPGVYRHLGLGCNDQMRPDNIYCFSASAPGRPVPIIATPEEAYKNLFGSIVSGSMDAKAAYTHRTNLLDFMATDVKRARNGLSGDERHKLDGYLEAFESMQARQSQLLAMSGEIKKHAPALPEKLAKERSSSLVLETQFDIAAAALISGMTNVITLVSGSGGQSGGSFPEIGVANSHHIGHGGSYPGMTYAECFVKVRQLHTQLIARLAKKLDAIKEGNGTMLDNTLIVYLSDSADGNHPSCYTWPVVLLGNLGGKLKLGGRYLDFPNYETKGHRTLANLYCTLTHAVGKPIDKFGVADVKLAVADQTGPLAELLA